METKIIVFAILAGAVTRFFWKEFSLNIISYLALSALAAAACLLIFPFRKILSDADFPKNLTLAELWVGSSNVYIPRRWMLTLCVIILGYVLAASGSLIGIFFLNAFER